MMNAKTKLVCQSDEIHINDNTQILMTVQPIINDAGEFAGLVQMISDITERKTLAKKLSEASTLERRKIGQDIHDGLCQMLSGIRFMASALQCELECCGSHLAKDAEDIVDHMKTALTMLRGLIQGLCPMGIEPQDLINSLKNLSGNIETVYKIKCNFCYDDSIIFSDYETANHLFLIAHESLYNAVKHSCCDAMDVSLLKKGKNIILSVKDNGLGIPPDLGSCKGMGIKIIRNRAMEIRGILSIHSEEGSGTSITVTIDEKNLNPVEDCHEQTV
jgi:signal transduction histidine kinase